MEKDEPPPSYSSLSQPPSYNSSVSQPPWKLSKMDFWPQVLAEAGVFSEPTYEHFGILLGRANDWLRQNPGYDIINCESVENKVFRGAHNPNQSYFTEGRVGYTVFIRGLRLWLRPRLHPGPPYQIGHFNVVPGMLRKPGFLSTPVFEDLGTVLNNLNNMLKAQPLPGKILTIETQDMKLQQKGLTNLTIDPDKSCWIEANFHGTFYLFVIRIFYICGPPCHEEVGLIDFLPQSLNPGHSIFTLPQYAPFHTCVQQAQGWIQQYQGGMRVTNFQSLEHKVGHAMDAYGFGNLDPSRTYFPVYAKHATLFVRGLRVAYVKYFDGRPLDPQPPITLTEKVFAPIQLSNLDAFGNCNFEGMEETFNRIYAWLKHVSVNVVGVEIVEFRIASALEGPRGYDVSLHIHRDNVHSRYQYVVRVYFDNTYQEPPPEVLPPVPSGITHWTNSDPKCVIQ